MSERIKKELTGMDRMNRIKRKDRSVPPAVAGGYL
jgi:hypothetical protein